MACVLLSFARPSGDITMRFLIAALALARVAGGSRTNHQDRPGDGACRASRRARAKPSRAAFRSRSTRSTRRWRARPQARARAARRRGDAGQGRDRRARAAVQGEGGRALRRPRHAGVARHRADREPGEDRVHRPVGGGHADHQERRQGELRVPRLGGGRDRQQGDAAVRAEDVQRQELRHDPRQQPVGRVEREGPEGRAVGQGA